jgi:DNA invertase Pin-like site-specific DNA recombinase
MSEQKLNNVGIYLRLSKDDERLGESLSIDNQRLILGKYVTEHGGKIIDEYIDDGYSGTNFDRPGVKRLLEDAQSKRIDTIVVKDLSRFGRNYIQVGQYIDYIFPAYNVRFIALNDNVDTADKNSSGMDMMPIMNIFNEWHSANTSKKIRAVLEASRRSGKFTASCYPYGYTVGKDENRTAVIDECAAQIVRRIFQMRAEGLSYNRIARILTNEKIPNPLHHYEKIDGGKINKDITTWWNAPTITNILNNPTYIGTLIQNKRTTVSYKNKQQLKRQPEEWIIKENAHEPIISRELWDKVQEVNKSLSHGRMTKSEVVHPLSGLLYCQDCGTKMKLSRNKASIDGGWYICRTYVALGKKYCTIHSISKKEIEQLVLADIHSMYEYIEFDEQKARSEFLRAKSKITDSSKMSDAAKLKAHKKRISELDLLIQSAFEEKVFKHIPESVCISLCEKYQDEKQRITEEIIEIENKLAVEKKDEDDVDEYIKRIKEYGKCEELTREIALQLIEYITVDDHPKYTKWDTPPQRNIHIYYKLLDNSKPVKKKVIQDI